MKFKNPAYTDPEELVFGRANETRTYGLGLSIGDGKVVPEINYWPKREADLDPSMFLEQYRSITHAVLERAVDLGVENLQLETELSHIPTLKPRLTAEITSEQRAIMEKYHKEYGINLALRVTVADVRFGFREITYEEALTKMLEAFEKAASSGANVLSIESMGGKEVFDYSLIRADMAGLALSLGVLAVKDMEMLWREISSIAQRYGVVAGGDTACGFANTAMELAGGMKGHMIPHCLAAVVRAMSAVRSLVAYEVGAVGPGKDCGYENVIVKAITGYPMSMEGKSSAVAHTSLVGNVSMATCDLWSNEQVENVDLFGGTGPQVSLEMLHYDTLLLNRSIKEGKAKILRDLLVGSNIEVDPQAYILSPKSAVHLAKAITNSEDHYDAVRAAALEAVSLLRDAGLWGERELKYLNLIEKKTKALPDDREVLLSKELGRYAERIQKLDLNAYGF